MIRGISLESFRSFRGPLFRKTATGQELFFAVSYSKLALLEQPSKQLELQQQGRKMHYFQKSMIKKRSSYMYM